MEPYPHQGILFYYVDVKTKMKDAVRTFYTHVLNAGDLSMLTDLCSDDLVFSDAVLYDEAFVGAKRVASVLRDYLAAYPTLRYSLVRWGPGRGAKHVDTFGTRAARADTAAPTYNIL